MIRRTTSEIANRARAVNTSEPTGDPATTVIILAGACGGQKPSKLVNRLIST